MTAADWHKRLWDGGLRFDMWHEVIDDLAAQEAEAETLGWGCDYWRGQAEKAEREKNLAIVEAIGHEHSEGHLGDLVDDLRRKLEEAERENYRAVWIEAAKQRDDIAAALVDALEKIEHNGCTEDAHVARAALAKIGGGK
jgi:hypothetical protein